jgi:hypothetical protein
MEFVFMCGDCAEADKPNAMNVSAGQRMERNEV